MPRRLRLEAGGTGPPSVYFPLLEDPAVIGVSASARPGERAAEAIARLESFVAGTIATAWQRRDCLGPPDVRVLPGNRRIPDLTLARNPYGVHFPWPAESN